MISLLLLRKEFMWFKAASAIDLKDSKERFIVCLDSIFFYDSLLQELKLSYRLKLSCMS